MASVFIAARSALELNFLRTLCAQSLPEWQINVAPREKSLTDACTGIDLPQADAAVLWIAVARDGWAADLSSNRHLLDQCLRSRVSVLVLLSSTAIYGASTRSPGLTTEAQLRARPQQRIPSSWQTAENQCRSEARAAGVRLVTLRLPVVLIGSRTPCFAHGIQRKWYITFAGYDPTLQILSARDLGCAIASAVNSPQEGTFNLAPRSGVSLRAMLLQSRTHRIPLPYSAFKVARITGIGSAPAEALEYLRYPWTVSGAKVREHLNFAPQDTSVDAVAEFTKPLGRQSRRSSYSEFDPFGMDRDYIARYGRTLFRFLSRYYWRIEVEGLKHVPEQGRAVLVGVHRGFMPWDGVMALHLLAERLHRIPRFLIHPGLLKFPFLFNFMRKLGGIVACQENAGYVLNHDELLGIFPEGIRGAFTPYRQAYELRDFGRDAFVRFALRHRAPIIPFVTVGSAEIFPILGRIDWGLWTRKTEWPFLPLTPTFPLVPLPLPSKWHTQFLAPLHAALDYPAKAADDPAIVSGISAQVRERMEAAIREMLQKRKSIFFGNIFDQASEEAG